MVKRISKKHIITAFLIFTIAIALASPSDYIAGTLSALILYAKNVLPALFPFIFFNKLLTMIGSANDLSVMLKKPLSKLYRAPEISGYVMIMSIFCGYPIGSKLTRDLFDANAITKEECFIISVLSNVCGPIFIIGTVSQMLGNSKYGYIIYFSHLLSAFINSFFYRPKQKPQANNFSLNNKYDDILGKSMIDSIISIALVGGYIAIMSFFITLLDKIYLTKLITTIFGFIGISDNVSRGVFYGLFEMTRGISAISSCNLQAIFCIPISTFLITFGGVCIALQSLNYTSKCGISAGKYLLSKLSQAVIATLISIIFVLLFLH